MEFYIKKNDTSPAMLATLQDANGNEINLTGASVRFHMRRIGKSEIVVDDAVSIVSASNGSVRYDFSANDTGKTGTYQAEFEVTYSDASIETFPNDGYISVVILDDIA